MKRLLYILTLVIVAALSAHGDTTHVQHHATWQQAVATGDIVDPAAGQDVDNGGKLMPLDATEAALLQVRVMSRVCETRPQRTISSHGNRLMRTVCRTVTAGNSLSLAARGRQYRQLWAAPFPTPVPTDYYVFALQRLLC